MKKNRDEIINFISENRDILRENYRVTRIALFGSFARNDYNDKSDIDFIVEFEKGTENLFDVKYELREYLSNNLGRNIDLCREKYLKDHAREKVMSEAIYV